MTQDIRETNNKWKTSRPDPFRRLGLELTEETNVVLVEEKYHGLEVKYIIDRAPNVLVVCRHDEEKAEMLEHALWDYRHQVVLTSESLIEVARKIRDTGLFPDAILLTDESEPDTNQFGKLAVCVNYLKAKRMLMYKTRKTYPDYPYEACEAFGKFYGFNVSSSDGMILVEK